MRRILVITLALLFSRVAAGSECLYSGEDVRAPDVPGAAYQNWNPAEYVYNANIKSGRFVFIRQWRCAHYGVMAVLTVAQPSSSEDIREDVAWLAKLSLGESEAGMVKKRVYSTPLSSKVEYVGADGYAEFYYKINNDSAAQVLTIVIYSYKTE